MADLLVRIHLFLARHRPAVMTAAVLFVGAAVLLGRRLKLNEDYTDMLPMSNPAIAEQVEALKRIRQTDRLFIDVQTVALDPELLTQAADRLNAALATVPDLGDLRYSFADTDAGEIQEQIQAQLSTLLSSNDLQALVPRLAPEAIRGRLAWFKKTLSQPQGLMLAQTIRDDPAGIGDGVYQRLRALQTGAGDARIRAGRITSPDGRHLLITAQPAFRASALGSSRVLLARVLEEARRVEREFPAGAVRVAVSGAHRVTLDNATMIQRDSVRTSVIATLAVAALLVGIYRHRWFALLSLTPTVFGALGATVALWATGQLVSAVALGCGSILIGVTVDYGILVLYHAEDAPMATRERLARAAAGLAPALVFGALTTAAAFFLMFASPVSGHRQLGAFGAASVLMAAAFAILILPLWTPLESARPAGVLPLTGVMQKLFTWRARRARGLLWLLAAVSVAAAAGICQLRFDGDLARFNGVTSATARDEQVIRETWGQALSLTALVASGPSREEALQANERVEALLRDSSAKFGIESVSSVASLLPSDRTRAENLRAWEAFWTEPRRHELSNTLAAASMELGFRPEAFLPFLRRVTPPLEKPARDGSGGSALDRLLGEYQTDREGQVSICTLVKLKEVAACQPLRAALAEAIPGTRLLNKAGLGNEIARIARRGLPVFAVLVVALNGLLLFLFLGRTELVLLTLLPMLTGVGWTLGVLGWLGLPIDMSNFIFVIFVLGVGGDYSLFLLLAELEPLRGQVSRAASTGGAVTICALTTLFGVGVLGLASHPALFSIGITALLGISLSWAAALCLVPLGIGALREREARWAGATLAQPAISTAARTAVVRRLYRYQGPYVVHFIFWKLRLDPMFEVLDRVVPPGSILDLGCGYGLVAHWLTLGPQPRTIYGIDADEHKVRVAGATAALNPRVRFERGDVLTRDYPACDTVLMCDLLHYLPHDLKLRVLGKAHAALKPGGCLVVRDALAEAGGGHRLVAVSERMGVWLGQNRTAHGLHFEDEKAYQRLLMEAGFVDIQMPGSAGLGSNRLLLARKAHA